MAFSELIALYLFLGGASAGSFAVISSIDLATAFVHARDRRYARTPTHYFGSRSRSVTQRRVARLVYSVAFAMIVLGLTCLLADLGRPDAFYMIFLYPTASFMSLGAFALAFLAICMAIALAEAVLVLSPAWEKAALVAKAAGVVLSLVVMLYTGMLLETVVAVPLWRSTWLPVLFLFSSLSCGCAVVLISTCFCESYEGIRAWTRKLIAADVAAVALEVVSAAALTISVNAASASRPFDALLVGDQAGLFWLGFVGCGILAPLMVELPALIARRRHASGVVAAMSLLVLVGGFCLRLALVNAGVQVAV
ncbi:MAG: polysulfide reductase NrfD [Eggerthellaceae bacterium]|nr:polysulfide reductase NrfD [Eggerthellaceae bacterium]